MLGARLRHTLAEAGRGSASTTPATWTSEFLGHAYAPLIVSRQRGIDGADRPRATSTMLGTFAAVESVAVGCRRAFRFLSLMIPVTRAAPGLDAPRGAGYS